MTTQGGVGGRVHLTTAGVAMLLEVHLPKGGVATTHRGVRHHIPATTLTFVVTNQLVCTDKHKASVAVISICKILDTQHTLPDSTCTHLDTHTTINPFHPTQF